MKISIIGKIGIVVGFTGSTGLIISMIASPDSFGIGTNNEKAEIYAISGGGFLQKKHQ